MPETNNQIVQQAANLRCSQKAAQKIAARLKSGPRKPASVAVLAELIAAEFEQLNP